MEEQQKRRGLHPRKVFDRIPSLKKGGPPHPVLFLVAEGRWCGVHGECPPGCEGRRRTHLQAHPDCRRRRLPCPSQLSGGSLQSFIGFFRQVYVSSSSLLPRLHATARVVDPPSRLPDLPEEGFFSAQRILPLRPWFSSPLTSSPRASGLRWFILRFERAAIFPESVPRGSADLFPSIVYHR